MNSSSQLNSYKKLFIALMSVLTCLFFLGGPDTDSYRSFKAAWNLGHIFYYALLPLVLFSFPWKTRLKQSTKAVLVVFITLILGIVVELVQNSLNRTMDIDDLYRNLIGASVAIIFFLPTGDFISKVGLIASKTIVSSLVILQLLPVGYALIDEYQARSDFPILSDFQSPFQKSRWVGSAVTEVVATPDKPNNKALNVTLSTAQYSGVSLEYFPKKFEAYSWLQFRVYNPSMELLRLTCRIHDRNHNNEYQDRFNKSYTIKNGWNSIKISLKEVKEAPKNRQMDLKEIRSIGIFAISLPEPRNILIDDMRLL